MDSLDKLKNWKERVHWWEKVSIPLDKLSNAPTSAASGNDNLAVTGPGRFSTFSSLSIISPLSETTLLEQFTNTIQPLISLLDDLSQVHEFVKAALAPFKAVYATEKKRRENNKRIMLLFLDMRDMMGMILQVSDISDQELASRREDPRLGDYMQDLMKSIGEDITHAYNVCEAYHNKSLISKAWHAESWIGKLAKCSKHFRKQREALNMALTAHSAHGVDETVRRLRTLEDRLDVYFMQVLRSLPADGEVEINHRIDLYPGGRRALQKNDSALEALLALEEKAGSVDIQSGAVGSALDRTRLLQEARPDAERRKQRLKELRDDLKTDVQAVIDANFQVFEGKLRIQLARIETNVGETVERVGDRVIDKLRGGPADHITNPDMYNVWTYMGWRASVKGSHFVLALKDYYHDTARDLITSPGDPITTSPLVSPTFEAVLSVPGLHRRGSSFHDESRGLSASSAAKVPRASIDPADYWTVKYIRVDRLKHILDAIDTDASGFITIHELNHFTQSRPRDWSLLKWIAYWAVGWEASLIKYYKQVRRIFGHMMATLHRVLPENRHFVDGYLDTSWSSTMSIVMNLSENSSLETSVEEHFVDYVASEERRLEDSLEQLEYNVKDTDAVRFLVDGPLERSLLPLLCILLQRHLEIFRLATYCSVSPSDLKRALSNASIAIRSIAGEHWLRARDVASNFDHHRRDRAQEFKLFTCGLYQNALEGARVFTAARLVELDDTHGRESQDVPNISVLASPVIRLNPISSPGPRHSTDRLREVFITGLRSEHDSSDEDSTSTTDYAEIKTFSFEVSEPTNGHVLKAEIMGNWSGYISLKGHTEIEHYVFQPVGTSRFKCDGRACNGDRFSVVGAYSLMTGKVHIRFDKIYADEDHYYPLHYDGILDLRSGDFSGNIRSITSTGSAPGGTFGSMPHDTSVDSVAFTFRHVGPNVMRHRPPTAEFNANRAVANWKYALNAITDQVREMLQPFRYLEERETKRSNGIQLLVKRAVYRDETTAGETLFRTLLPEDTRACWSSFNMAHKDLMEQYPRHSASCDVCHRHGIPGVRIVCLDCPRSDHGLVNFCPTIRCSLSQVLLSTRTDLSRPHMPIHSLLRIPYVMHLGMEASVLERARAGIARAGKFLEGEKRGVRRDENALRRALPGRKSQASRPRCVMCKQDIMASCWYCVDCQDPIVLCNKCGLEEIHHQTHLLVKLVMKKESVQETSVSLEQRLAAFKESTEGKLEKITEEHSEGLKIIREEMITGMQAIRDEVQCRLERIESLLVEKVVERAE